MAKWKKKDTEVVPGSETFKLKQKIEKVFCIHISYIYYAKRCLTPLVHYKLGGIPFKRVKIFGRVVGFKSHYRGDFVLTVDDHSGEILCYIKRYLLDAVVKRRKCLNKHIDTLKSRSGKTTHTEDFRLGCLAILQKTLDKHSEKCFHTEFELEDYVEIIGNVGPNSEYSNAIYVFTIRKVPMNDEFILEYKPFLEECQNNFEKFKLNTDNVCK